MNEHSYHPIPVNIAREKQAKREEKILYQLTKATTVALSHLRETQQPQQSSGPPSQRWFNNRTHASGLQEIRGTGGSLFPRQTWVALQQESAVLHR